VPNNPFPSYERKYKAVGDAVVKHFPAEQKGRGGGPSKRASHLEYVKRKTRRSWSGVVESPVSEVAKGEENRKVRSIPSRIGRGEEK